MLNAWNDYSTGPGGLQATLKASITAKYKTETEVLGGSTDTGFVALLNAGGAAVERFNYRDLEGLTLNTLDGNDYVVLDDVIAPTTINLGLGEDKVQVGQVFRSERVKDPGPELITGITAEDVFASTEITRGWLSNGISRPTTINGGDGNDQFTVFRNVAVLNLNGGDGDDLFTVRAFALKGSSDSERARTDMKGDGGADTILYVVNAPVGIDGGDGFDTVRIVGTEFADDFVITDSGIFGAGLSVSYVNIEKLVADGAEGDDRFFVQSTGLEVVTEIDGGLGSDSFFVGGNPSNAPVAVISNDFKGHSGIILHSVESGDPTWAGTPVEGISANVGDNEEAFVIVSESGGSSRVVEGDTSGDIGWTFDGYGIRLTRRPGFGETVTITVVPAGMAPEDEAKGFKDLEFYAPSYNLNDPLGASLGFNPLTGLAIAPTLTFTANDLDPNAWNKVQYVRFKAADDAASEGRRFVFINHTLQNSTDPDYQSAQMLSVKVLMEDDDRDGLIITPSGRGNTVLEGGSGVGFDDTFTVRLAKQPTNTVTVAMTTANGQVSLTNATLTFSKNTADANAWNKQQTVTIHALNDSVVEGFHTDYIRYTVTSTDADELLPTGGGAAGTPPAFVQIDGDFDLLGVQAIPVDKPTSYVLLPNRPDLTQAIAVKVGGVDLDSTRFVISGNTLTFLSADGTAEFRTGQVQIKYSYKELGYSGSFVKDSSVDLYDGDTPMVIVETVDDGSVDVIEGSTATDQYSIRLSKAPSALQPVNVVVDSVDTRATYGRTVHFVTQVNVSSTGDVDGDDTKTTLTFTNLTWNTPQFVTVSAIDDSFLDGNDTQVFAPDLQTVNKIRGPLIIEGAAGAGSLSLPKPLMLPGEKNILKADGVVKGFTAGSGGGAIETMKVLRDDLVNKVIARLTLEDSTITSIQDLVGRTLELSEGPGTGVVLDPLRPEDKFDRFWLINKVVPIVDGDSDSTNDLVELTLQNPSLVDPGKMNVTAPAAGTTTYAITSLSVNFFADEREQVEYLFVFDEDSVANDKGRLTSSDGAVQSFTPSLGSTESMVVETSALQAVLKLDAVTVEDQTNVNRLVGRRLEITVADDVAGIGRAWTIASIADGASGFKVLTLTKPEPDAGGVAPTNRSEFRIAGGDTHGRITGFGMGPNVLFAGRPQGGGITYGDIEVVQMSLGSGNDDVVVDYTTNAEDHTTKRTGDFYTLTMLDTGAGDDHVTVSLQNGDDGAFALNLNAGNDIADGSASSLPLVVFGWDGQDTITGGSGDDILFGDRGRVDYVKTVAVDNDNNSGTPTVLVDQIVTRLGHSVAPNPVNPPVTGATATSVSDASTTFSQEYGGLVGLSVQAISPQGHVQYRTIVANDAHTIWIDRPWDAIPTINTSLDPLKPNNYYYRVSAVPEDQTDGQFRGPRVVWSIDNEIGGNDVIYGGIGTDMIIGGAGVDTISGGTNSDWIAGDNARLDFEPVAGNDGQTRIKSIKTAGFDVGGNDTISGDAGADIILGGAAGDTIYGDAASPGANDGADIVIGDNGVINYNGGYAGSDSNPATIDLIQATDPASLAGTDTIYGNAGNDILIGGAGGDNVSGDADLDIILGDQGTVRLFDGKITYIQDPGTPGDDFLTGGAGTDLIIGGLGADKISGLGGADILIGDEAEVFYGLGDGVTITKIDSNTLNPGNGGVDTIFGGTEDDIIIGGANNDRLDGGDQQDLIFGDNVMLVRNAGSGNAIDPRFRALTGTTIYDANGLAQVAGEFGATVQPVPGGRPTWADWTITQDQSSTTNHFGDDYIAGGAHNDEIFGQLGNDTIQGDGTIGPVTGTIPATFFMPSMTFLLAAGGSWNVTVPTNSGANRTTGTLSVIPSFEGLNDGDDYIEGNGGNDVIFGNLGQDDIIGGSSNLFSLTTPGLRPDGLDSIFGGAGTDISRNNLGDASLNLAGDTIVTQATGHSRDADMILGDNGNIFRLVGTNGGNSGNYLTFNYDNYNAGTGSTNKIIPRAAELLDYTPGGPDFTPAVEGAPADIAINPVTGLRDIGAADELHGESGDDFIYGMTGSDVLFGEGQDDDLIGGYGNDWISGGTGDDGVIGDDGRVITSRNGTLEPLNGVTTALALDTTIKTGGSVQLAVINVTGQLKKAVNLTPFSQDPSWNPATDEFAGTTPPPHHSDDIIFGGWGNDFLHGGSGDDAISGGEALAVSYAPIVIAGVASGRIQIDYDHPNNPGNVLAFNPIDANGKSSNRTRAGEFYLYDEYDPLRKILFNPDGSASKWTTATPSGFEYFLNFSATEGPAATQDSTKKSDGDDKIFGDLGNDWLVGGSGRDDMYGGFGNDLLNADDDLLGSTGSALNNTPDTSASYEDRAFGGAGRDVLIANTGGDRLIDWSGEFNSYLVPFSPFGVATVSRMMQPALPEFLYALSASDGADPTRAGDVQGADLARNGEPYGELGLVLQKDAAWKDQHGGPADPQPGNIGGTQRDVLRSATFTAGGAAQGFNAQVGTGVVVGTSYQSSPAASGGDAISLFNTADTVIPVYFEMQATINAVKATGGNKANAFLIFDWQSNTDFKFAGIDISTNKLEVGHRTASGWVVDNWTNVQVKADTDYVIMLKANGSTATAIIGTSSVSFTFAPRVVIGEAGIKHLLNEGIVGVGGMAASARIANVIVQKAPEPITVDVTADFSSTSPSSKLFKNTIAPTGTWVSGTNNRFAATTTDANVAAINLASVGTLPITAGSLLNITTTVKTSGMGGVVFDYQGPNYYKYVVLSKDTNQILVGHRAGNVWTTDAAYAFNVSSSTDYNLGVSLRGGLVNVSINGAVLLSKIYIETVTIGGYGLISRMGVSSGASSFDIVRVSSDEGAYAPATPLLQAAAADPATFRGGDTPSAGDLAALLADAKARWAASGLDAASIAKLDAVTVQLADLPGAALGEEVSGTVFVDLDAAGRGWFIDQTPQDNAEFHFVRGLGEWIADAHSPASSRMDLLTTVMHELGHVLGFDDQQAQRHSANLMTETLSTGVRRSPLTESMIEEQPAPGAEAFSVKEFLGRSLKTFMGAWGSTGTGSVATTKSLTQPVLSPVIDWTEDDSHGEQKKSPMIGMSTQKASWLGKFLIHTGREEAKHHDHGIEVVLAKKK